MAASRPQAGEGTFINPVQSAPGYALDWVEAGQCKVPFHVPAYASATEVDEQQERLAMLQRIPEQATAALNRLSVPNYHVDRTLRREHSWLCWHPVQQSQVGVTLSVRELFKIKFLSS